MLDRNSLVHLPRLAIVLFALAGTSNATSSWADSFPGNNTVRIVAPTGPGAPPDVLSRVIATEISESEGWRVIVENRPGGLQTIAMTDVLKQSADGLSVFTMSTGAVATPTLLPNKGIKLEFDFAPVVEIASGPIVLVVHPSVPAASITELVALMKAHHDKYILSSGGFGTPAHLSAEVFKLQTGVRATIVPYPQPQQRMADLLSGTTQIAFYNTPAVVEHIATGRLRAIAITASQRIATLKDVPTVDEQGFPGLLMMDWQGFVVKQGSPHDAIARLNAAVNKAIAKPKIRDALARIGYDVVGGTPAGFGELIKSQVAYWGKVVTDSGIKVAH